MKDELQNIIDSGILSASEIDFLITMNKKAKVLKIHKSKISKGGGKDTRWFTRVDGRKIAAKTEEELIDKLYEIYFGKKKSLCVKNFYEEWFSYKELTSNRPSNTARIRRDFDKFYLEDPLSREFIEKPFDKMTPYDIKLWIVPMIKKHKLTRKQFGNIMVPIRQMMDLLEDKRILDSNTARNISIDRGLFHPESIKPEAETQVFFHDELENIIAGAKRLAIEKQDTSYLAIPMCLYTGVRPGECYALRFSDFNRKKNSLCISRSLVEGPDHKYHVEEYLKKNSKPRTITIPDAAFEIVDMVSRIHCSLNERDTQNDLFKVMYPGNIDRKLYRICDDLGIVRRSLNKLRKTHISMLINSGFDIDFVRRQAGHTNINTTLNNYTYQTRKDAEMVRKMNRELEQFGTPALEKEKDPERLR